MSYLALAKKAEEELRSSNKPSLIPQDSLIHIRAWIVGEIRGPNGNLRAIQICSAMLEAHLWVVWDRSYEPTDTLAVYYAEELPLLRGKSMEDLKLIQETKLVFPGCRVVQ